MIIGIDFDNTLVCYDQLLLKLLKEQGFKIKPNITGKKKIRDWVRCQHDGESIWQKMQAKAYGPRINEADIFQGAYDFLQLCKKKGVTIYIVSHKTPYAAADSHQKNNLRGSAIKFLHKKGFFDNQGGALSQKHIFFENNRYKKINKIKSLNCDIFIDDLSELFLDINFPKSIKKILFSPHNPIISAQNPITAAPNPIIAAQNINICSNWQEIAQTIFG
ncbi:conserved hypothetical protein [Desulfamplus magnetovallimortis]|uniref:Haloacid dehalogenase-like hydrolase n=1 Tax=Desulfamplus magnetovallimortis TaxID=1246637 RepID=A0A1W1HEY2_9BACT|nr:hypothetical protein [Desulfamplus magnetovallimortis]SLM30986.1 conserved hypothetical protein [Desulfamplus magnetovallimortis]